MWILLTIWLFLILDCVRAQATFVSRSISQDYRCNTLIVIFLVFITSPSIVYIDTSIKCPYYSQNDEDIGRVPKNNSSKKENSQDTVKLIDILEEKGWLNIRTVLKDREFEIQDVVAFIGKFNFSFFVTYFYRIDNYHSEPHVFCLYQ